ncbi:MAG: lysophospholipid acyltransferase family protein [Desulfobacterales bacterium]|nr:lysophospholipid acyltransferase family protein [Desulfobacterales bacterium]
MKRLFYSILTTATRIFGLWLFALVAKGIAAGYYLFFPRRVAVGIRFYRALFPGRSRLYYRWCTWRQFQNFTSIFTDRILLAKADAIGYTYTGWEHLEKILDEKRGAVILMSHLGNWEIAAHLLNRRRKDIRLLLYMGAREKKEIEGMQKASLKESGVRIIAVDANGGSPFDVVEGIRMIESGGLVSLAGDRVWGESLRTVPVRFLGHKALLPEGPHLFSLLTGVPLLVFFAFRTGRGQYHFTFSEPIFLPRTDRGGRRRAIEASAQAYADRLAETLRNNPFEWYHFEPFLGQPLEASPDPDTGAGGAETPGT